MIPATSGLLLKSFSTDPTLDSVLYIRVISFARKSESVFYSSQVNSIVCLYRCLM